MLDVTAMQARVRPWYISAMDPFFPTSGPKTWLGPAHPLPRGGSELIPSRIFLFLPPPSSFQPKRSELINRHGGETKFFSLPTSFPSARFVCLFLMAFEFFVPPGCHMVGCTGLWYHFFVEKCWDGMRSWLWQWTWVDVAGWAGWIFPVDRWRSV